MKVGILTYHRAINYGAFLQAYALCETINKEEGIQAELIDFNMQKEVDYYNPDFRNMIKKPRVFISRFVKHPIRFFNTKNVTNKQRILFERDLEKLKKSLHHHISDACDEFTRLYKNKYDVIIAGSDEIWKLDGFRGFPNPYWLYGDLGCRKFSYAASSRTEIKGITEVQKKEILNMLCEFEFIGVRDTTTKNVLKQLGLSNVHMCCDPTFLYDFEPDPENGRKILIDRFHADGSKKIIGYMSNSEKMARKIREELKDQEYELVSIYEWQEGFLNGCEASPFEWLDILSALDLLITSYFHATCFAMKFGTPMISFGTSGKAIKVREVITGTIREKDYFDDLDMCIRDKELQSMVQDRISRREERFIPGNDFLAGYRKMIGKIRAH